MYHKQIKKIITKEIYKKKYYDEIIAYSKLYINILFKEDLPTSFCFSIICFLFIFLMYVYGEEKIQFIYKEASYERYYDIKNIHIEFYDISFTYVNGLNKCIINKGIYDNKIISNITDTIWRYSDCGTTSFLYTIILPILIIFLIAFVFFITCLYDLYMLKQNIKYSKKKLNILNNIV